MIPTYDELHDRANHLESRLEFVGTQAGNALRRYDALSTLLEAFAGRSLSHDEKIETLQKLIAAAPAAESNDDSAVDDLFCSECGKFIPVNDFFTSDGDEGWLCASCDKQYKPFTPPPPPPPHVRTTDAAAREAREREVFGATVEEMRAAKDTRPSSAWAMDLLNRAQEQIVGAGRSVTAEEREKARQLINQAKYWMTEVE